MKKDNGKEKRSREVLAKEVQEEKENKGWEYSLDLLESIIQQKTTELLIANKELIFQNEEKEKRAAELLIANKELVIQNEEKEKREYELIVANKELAFQNDEKDKRAAELVLANRELIFQTGEKADRAAELVIADKELDFQIGEKADRAAELVIANKELIFQNEEKEKRAAELIIANRELVIQNEEKENRAKDLIYMIYHDYLTGLYNRRYFEEALKRLDTKINLPISIIICDINGLKLVNDSFGHSFGDELLRKAAETIKKACRADDVVARLGGDEFVIILPKTDGEETAQIANYIKEFAPKVKVDKIELSISCGYDTKITDEQMIIGIFATAENNMYRHKLYERSSMRNKTIDLVMKTLFEKSNRESLHSERVSNACQAIASKMNFNKSDIDKMRIAGLVHDIGKMGIDDKILNKAGSLNTDERHKIEGHPEIGWRILSTTNEFLELAQIVLNHHERWDGSGYPNGLKGEDIPLESRIIAVADAYDAMISERSYRKGLDKEEAIKEMKRCSGTQFDPGIVDVFVNQVLPYKCDFVGGSKTLLSTIENM